MMETAVSSNQESTRPPAEVKQMETVEPSVDGGDSFADAKEPDEGSSSALATDADSKGPLQPSIIQPKDDTMTRTKMATVPEENAAAPSVPPIEQLTRMLPSRRRNRGSTVVTRQLSLAKVDTSEPEPSEPIQISSSSTGISATSGSNAPSLPQKGRKERIPRATRRKPGVPIKFQGWSRIPSARSVTTGTNTTPMNQNIAPRIFSVNMAGEMMGATNYNNGDTYTDTASGHTTSSRSISISSLRDTVGQNYRNLGWSSTEATSIEHSDRSTSTRSVSLRNQTLPSHVSASPLTSNRTFTIKEGTSEEEGRIVPLPYRIRPAMSNFEARPSDSSIDTTDDAIPSTEATPPPPVMDYGPDDDGPEIMEDSPKSRPKTNVVISDEEAERLASLKRMVWSASSRATTTAPGPIQPENQAIYYSNAGNANADHPLQPRFLAGDSRFRASTAARTGQLAADEYIESVSNKAKPTGVATIQEENEPPGDNHRVNGAFGLFNSSEKVPSLSEDSSLDVSTHSQLHDVEQQQPIPAARSAKISRAASVPATVTRSQLQDVEQQRPIRGKSSATFARSSVTARVSTAGRVSTIASNVQEEDDEELITASASRHKSLGTIRFVNMRADKDRSSTKKHCLICVLIFVVLLGGIAGAATYFSLDAAKEKPLPTKTGTPTPPSSNVPTLSPIFISIAPSSTPMPTISSAPTSAPMDLGRL